MKRLTMAAQQIQLQQTQESANKDCNAVTDISSDSPMLPKSTPVTPPASSIAQPSQVGFRAACSNPTVSDLGTLVGGSSPASLKIYPKNKKDRCFRVAWHTNYPWLEYSIAQDKAFCFACRNLSLSTCKSDTAFVQVGFSPWAKAMENNGGLKPIMHAAIISFL